MSRESIRRAVRTRAGGRCEYCRMLQDAEPTMTYQIEHVIAIQHGGGDGEDNLAVACPHCNRRKGPNLSGIDPETGRIEILFHPRLQEWSQHFQQVGAEIRGLSPAGRATVAVLGMNFPDRRRMRDEVRDDG